MEWQVLRALTRGQRLEEGRIPIAIVTTDLLSRQRIVLRSGLAAEAMYASAALAGIFPPLRWNGHLLVDGAYADPVPVDVARNLGVPVVIAVEPQSRSNSQILRNGLEAMIRAMEVCSMEHAAMRRREADLVLHPVLHEGLDMLDFEHGRACIAAGLRCVRASAHELQRVLAV